MKDTCCPLCNLMEEMNPSIEAAPLDLLIQSGVDLPPASELDDQQITTRIGEIVEGLMLMNVAITSTDHLSDRELYALLTESLLKETMDLIPDSLSGGICIDVIGGFSNEDIDIYLTYYADDEDRARWAKDFPDDDMPEKKPRPYDRDRFLPTIETLVARNLQRNGDEATTPGH